MAIPKIFQQLVAAVLISTMALPAWSQPQVAGTVIATQSASLRDAPLLPGSTVFSGESVSVNTMGSAQIALPGGGQIQILSDSTVRLARNQADPANIDFTLQRGAISFASGPKGGIQTVLGDATIRPADPSAVGLLHLESSDSAVLAAVKGSLTISTQHDAQSVDVPEGSAVRITLVDAPQNDQDNQSNQGAGAKPAGRAAPSVRKIALIAFLIGAAFLGALLWVATHQPSQTSQQSASEVSPFTLQ